MRRSMIVPELAGNIYAIVELLSLYGNKVYSSGVSAKLFRTDPKLAERFAQGHKHIRGAYSRLDSGRSIDLLVMEGPATVAGLREHLVTVGEVERFIQKRRLSEAMNFVSVSTEEYELRLTEVTGPVGRLRPVHTLVHRHCSAVGLEYLVKEGDEPGEEQPYRELKQEFGRPLMASRDAFFQEASDAHLESYVATALELAEQEHPLASVVGKKTFVQRLPAQGERVTELLDKLSVASLMASVLEV